MHLIPLGVAIYDCKYVWLMMSMKEEAFPVPYTLCIPHPPADVSAYGGRARDPDSCPLTLEGVADQVILRWFQISSFTGRCLGTKKQAKSSITEAGHLIKLISSVLLH